MARDEVREEGKVVKPKANASPFPIASPMHDHDEEAKIRRYLLGVTSPRPAPSPKKGDK